MCMFGSAQAGWVPRMHFLYFDTSKNSGGIMESRAKFLGHPIHQQLIVFPLGLLGMAVIFDLFTFATKHSRWTEIAFYMIGAGIVTGLLAAVFGLVDWFSIPKNTRAKRI